MHSWCPAGAAIQQRSPRRGAEALGAHAWPGTAQPNREGGGSRGHARGVGEAAETLRARGLRPPDSVESRAGSPRGWPPALRGPRAPTWNSRWQIRLHPKATAPAPSAPAPRMRRALASGLASDGAGRKRWEHGRFRYPVLGHSGKGKAAHSVARPGNNTTRPHLLDSSLGPGVEAPDRAPYSGSAQARGLYRETIQLPG